MAQHGSDFPGFGESQAPSSPGDEAHRLAETTGTASVSLSRRTLFGALALAAVATRARAGGWATDIGVHAEPSLAPALKRVAQAFTRQSGIGVAVLAAPPALLLAQIQRNPAEDILAVPVQTLDEAGKRGFIAADTRRDVWKNPMLLAARPGAPSGNAAALLAAGPVAVTDATVASAVDGRAVLTALGLSPGPVIGTANTLDAASLVLSGKAVSALIFATDLQTIPELRLGAALGGTSGLACGFALNVSPPSKNAKLFWTYLQQPEAKRRLAAAGLEIAA